MQKVELLNNIFHISKDIADSYITMSFNELILIEVSCYTSEPLTEVNGNILDQSGGNTIFHILII